MPIVQNIIATITGNASPPPPPPASVTYSAEGGSIYFNGSSSYVRYPASSDWAFGTGDFTIEWYQWMLPGKPFPRIFSMGMYPGAAIAVSIEGTTFYFWGPSGVVGSAGISNFLEQWVHFAVARQSGTTKIFQNGNEINSFVDNNNYAEDSIALYLGNESSPSNNASFFGYLTNFRWTKGSALYTNTFTPPAVPLTVGPDTKLLLLAATAVGVYTDATASHNEESIVGTSWLGVGPYSQRADLDAGNGASYSDPSATWYDLTSYQNNVSLTSTTFSASAGGHLIFGPGAYGEFISNPAVQNENKLPSAAITMWANIPNNNALNYIAGVRNDNDFDLFFLILSSGLTEARIKTTAGINDINVSFSAYFNSWTHICFTVNGTVSQLYLNGVLVGSTNFSGNFGTPSSNFTIAQGPFGQFPTDNLNLAQLRYHTRARTAAEILAEFNAEKSRYGL